MIMGRYIHLQSIAVGKDVDPRIGFWRLVNIVGGLKRVRGGESSSNPSQQVEDKSWRSSCVLPIPSLSCLLSHPCLVSFPIPIWKSTGFYRKIVPVEQLGWLAPARQLMLISLMC